MSHIVLVGAGHVHMAVVARVVRLHEAGHRVTLIDPGTFWWGLEPGRVAAGSLRRHALRVALAERCEKLGVRYCRDRAIGLETRHRRIWLAGGDRLEYDRVSLNVGYEKEYRGFDGASAGVQIWNASNVEQLVWLHDALARMRGSRVAIVGQTPQAVEIAAALSMPAFDARPRLSCFGPGSRLLTDAPKGVARRAARVLALRGVDVLMQTDIEGAVDGCIRSGDGRRFQTEHIVLADERPAARFVHACGLPSENKGLEVTQRLHSPRDERVFASGGCAVLSGQRVLDIADVAGQAHVIIENLLASEAHRPMTDYRAGARSGLLDLANGRAIVWRGPLWWHGPVAARLRSRRDQALRDELQITN